MKEKANLVKVYTGTEITANLLAEELEKAGVPATIRNDFKTGLSGGILSGVPSAVDVYITETDLKKARPVITGFLKINK
jgi:hypothetical protein